MMLQIWQVTHKFSKFPQCLTYDSRRSDDVDDVDQFIYRSVVLGKCLLQRCETATGTILADIATQHG